MPEATPTTAATAVVQCTGVGRQGGHARYLTAGYSEPWDPHLEGTIEGPEGISPRCSQVVEFNPTSPKEVIGGLAERWTASDYGRPTIGLRGSVLLSQPAQERETRQ